MPNPQTPPFSALLQLAALQIEVALQAAESQVETLSEAVAAMSGLAAALPPSVGEAAAAMTLRAREAMVAMQFHDQLTQRLAHVRDALSDVHRAMVKPADAHEWQQLLSTVRGRYSMEDERLLFDKMLARPMGYISPPREVLPDSTRGCIELF